MVAMTDHYDARGRLCEEPDTEWYRENWEPIPEPPQLIRLHGRIWVCTAEGHWCRCHGATAALEIYEEAERRYQEYAA